MAKKRYFATLSNDSGASTSHEFSYTSKRTLIEDVRARWGRGWMVDIVAHDLDSEGQMDPSRPPETVQTFRLRG